MPGERNSVRIVIDVNLWVSFAIGKQAIVIRNIVLHPLIESYTTSELIAELKDVLKRPKLKKYITALKAKQALQLIKQSSFKFKSNSEVIICRDSSDDYLLAIAKDCQADYLITGDKDLLDMKNFEQTEIITLELFVKRFL